jgi:signal recognition particle receptor subunit beta
MDQEKQATHMQPVPSGTHAALTSTREAISPFLPPPALKLIQFIDTNPQITKYVENEPSMTILVSLLSIYFLATLIKFLSFRGKAVEGLDDDEPEGNVLSNLNDEQYQDSVILCGPCGSGKSLLFHQLTKNSSDQIGENGDKSIHTVMSLKANVNVVEGLRIVDYPGHITLSEKLPSLLLPQNTPTRAVFVVDSTKSLSEAAVLLYRSVLTNPSVANAWRKSGEVMKIMVACNKSDETGAKNWRRVKIQLRSELDKLKKISSSIEKGEGENSLVRDGDNAGEELFELSGKTIDLDDLSKNGLEMMKLNFLSLSAKNGDGMKELEAFVTNGEVLTDNSSILKSRK